MEDSDSNSSLNVEKSEETQSSKATTNELQSVNENQSANGNQSANEYHSNAAILNSEFVYYSSLLRIYAPALSKDEDKVTSHLWIKKLCSAGYHSTLLKPKRNQFLLYLTITLFNDETFGIFKEEPSAGALPEIKDITLDSDIPPAEWEMETQWSDTLDDLPDCFKEHKCHLHNNSHCPPGDENLSSLLDAEFHYFLWLSRPYVSSFSNVQDKTKAACWIQTLCTLAPAETDCLELKLLRNDYMQALLGYVHCLNLDGPFLYMPDEDPLPTLEYKARETKKENPFGDPKGHQSEEFLIGQPLPENGAFAYINITGELFNGIN